MKMPRNMFVLAGGIVFAILVALSGFLLYRGFSGFSESERTRDERRTKLEELYKLNPFPSDQNVARQRENVTKLNALFDELLSALRRGQVKPTETSPTTFMNMLSAKRNVWIEKAKAGGTTLTPELYFGMERYLLSSGLPAPEHVPKLTLQLLAVERIVNILFAEHAAELAVVKRQEFEAATAAPGSPRPARPNSAQTKTAPAQAQPGQPPKPPARPPEELFSSLRFTFEFKAKEKALTAILNRIAADETFMVIRRLDISKDVPDVRDITTQAPPEEDAAPAAAPATPQKKLTRQERLVSGVALEAPMRVAMEVDVYRFREAQ
jgi:hypothetical protein